MDYLAIFVKIFETGGPAVIALLTILCFYLGWEKYQQKKQYDKIIENLTAQHEEQVTQSHDNLMKVVERYQEGQIRVIEAMNETKVLLATIGAKLD